MSETISATDANRRFSEMLREVDEGKSFVITSHGREIAYLQPAAKARAERDEAYRRLLEHLDSVEPINGGTWTRQELYED